MESFAKNFAANAPSILGVIKHQSDPLSKEIIEVVEAVSNHPAYTLVNDMERARRFMEFHVWCVWDFMLLAKAVQTGIGCYKAIWYPPADAEAVHAINTLVADEEADLGPSGRRQSHFEIYLDAMREAGASTTSIEVFLQRLIVSNDVIFAMRQATAPPACVQFVQSTIEIANSDIHRRVSALCIAREELVPRLLHTMLKQLPEDSRLDRFRWYINRHIAIDQTSHGPLSSKLFCSVTELNDKKIEEALSSALQAVKARKVFLDDIFQFLKT